MLRISTSSRRWFAPMALLAVLPMLAAACGGSGTEPAANSTAEAAPADTDATPTATPTPAPTATAVPTPTPVDPRAARPFSFTESTFTVVDSSLITPATGSTNELPERTIEVWLYMPDGDKPVPLVVFAHGLAGHPDKFEVLHRRWAEAGYGVDPDRVGTAGLSLGGATTYEVGVNDLARDDRFRATIVMAGVRFTNTSAGTFVAPSDIPVYLMHGDADPLLPLSIPESAYQELEAPRFFVTLLGGGHAGPFEDEGGFEEKVPGMDEVVHTSTIAFWDAYLLGEPVAVDELIASAAADGISILVYDAP